MGMKKRLCALFAAVCCLTQMTLAAAAEYPAWAAVAMERWAACGKLDEAVAPEQAATRGDLALLLDGVMPYEVQAENTFSDLPAQGAYTDAVLRLVAAGILQGSGTQMRPEATVTRQEAAVMTARAFGLVGTETPDYADRGEIAPLGGTGCVRPPDGGHYGG